MSKKQPRNLIAVDKIVAINCFELSPKFSVSEDRHTCWEFIYVDSGEVRCYIGEREMALRQGDAVFHRPDEVHGTVCNGKNAASIFNIIFDCRSPSMASFAERSMRVPQKLTPLLKKLIKECKNTYYISKYPLQMRELVPTGGEQLVRLYFEEFLIFMLRACRDESKKNIPTSTPEEPNNALVEQICAYLKENVCGKVTLKILTERFHFGKSYLCEQFKRCKGCSIVSYHLELKLALAKRLLREENRPIHEISEELGFESPEYFSRYFRKRVGHSPRNFRNMLINEDTLTRKD